MRTVLNFKKDKLYVPDSMDDLPMMTSKYFSSDGFEEWGRSIYEYGTCRCIKSFEITITIKEK